MNSTEFLKKFSPEGPWNLVAIHPVSGATVGQTFLKLTAVEQWLKIKDREWNIYYTVNSLREPIEKKPSRKDIKSMDWLHVDIDVQKGETLEEGLDRIKKLKPKELPDPTLTVFSGGGYQLLFKLQEPVTIDGREELYEQAKLYNVWLEEKYGGDACHNVDRILRLPGTINLPTKKKLQKHPDRKPVRAEVVKWDDGLVYGLDKFQMGEARFESPISETAKKEMGEIPVVADLNELDKWGIPEWCKELAAFGEEAKQHREYASRSEAQFAVSCEFSRRGVPEEIHYSILTDPKWGISASVLDKKSRAHKYALKQIENSRRIIEAPQVEPPEEEPKTDLLDKMNERYFVGMISGKCRVFEEQMDPVLKRARLVKIAFNDFENFHMNKWIKTAEDKDGNARFTGIGEWWLSHRNRRQYSRIVFKPGEDAGADEYNMWKGFGVASIPGDKHVSFLEHLKSNICSNVDEYYEYLIGWMALAVQDPARPGEVAVVMRGKQGTGKGAAARFFGHLFGRHYMQVSDPKHLVGNFNYHLRDCVVLFADEAFYAGDKAHEANLKALITEPTLTIESKGVDAEVTSNFIHLFMASNSDWVVPAGAEERRFFMLDVADTQMQNADYFESMRKDLEGGGFSNLLHYFQNYDLSKYNLRKVPQTKALAEQKVENLRGLDRWIIDLAYGGRLPEGDRERINKGYVLIDNLVESAMQQHKSANKISLGRFAKKIGLRHSHATSDRSWCFPPLKKFREMLTKRYGWSEWPDDGQEDWEFLLPKEDPFE